jgi:hypothetical protein
MLQKLPKPAKRKKSCQLPSCSQKFEPQRRNQVFCSTAHRQQYWAEIQDAQATEDYRRFLLVRDKFRRYLANQSRIDAWLKANKK